MAETKKTKSSSHRKGKDNQLGVKRWTGAMVIQLRRRFAPDGSDELPASQLAELMGFGHSSSITRIEKQKRLGVLSSFAFELVERLLTEKAGEQSQK